MKWIVPLGCFLFLLLSGYPAVASDSSTRLLSTAVSEAASFKVVGTIVSDRALQSLAVIETEEGGQRFIREGAILDEMIVKKILADGVLFETRFGERVAKLNRGILEAVDAEEHAPALVPVRLPEASYEKEVELDVSKVFDSLTDIDAVVREVSISPVSIYDETVGIRIYPIPPGSIFEQLGLQTGDIITAVNGEEIRKPEEAVNFLEQIRYGGDFDIRIRGPRRDAELRIVVN